MRQTIFSISFILCAIMLLVSTSGSVIAFQQDIIDPLYEQCLGEHIRDIEWRPDGDILAVATAEGVQFFTTSLDFVVGVHRTDYIHAFEWHPDGNQFAITVGNNIEIWDWSAGRQSIAIRIAILEGREEQAALAWSNDGMRLASVEVGFRQLQYSFSNLGVGTILIWDTRTWMLQSTSEYTYLVDMQLSTANIIDWSPDSTRIAGVRNRVSIRDNDLWFESNLIAYILDGNTGQELQQIPVIGPDAYSVVWHPNGDTIVVGEEATSTEFDLATTRALRNFVGWAFDITVLDFHPSGAYLLTDNTVFDLATREIVGGINTGGIVSGDWHPNGIWIATGNWNGCVDIFDATTLANFSLSD